MSEMDSEELTRQLEQFRAAGRPGRAQRDQNVILVGASFEEINTAAAVAVKEQIDLQVQEVTPTITKALEEGAAVLNQATTLIKRYRIALYLAAFVIGLESAVLFTVLIHH